MKPMWNKLSHFIDWILSKRILTHILFWIGIVFISLLYGLGLNQPLLVSLILKGIVLPVQIIASYIFIYWQLSLLYRKKYWLFVFSFCILSYIYQVLVHFSNDFGLGTYLTSWHKPHDLTTILTDFSFFILLNVDVYVLVFIVAAIKLIKDNIESQRQRALLETEKARTEYSILQAKIQPQFLLNTLQFIEQESLQKSSQTPQIIEDLADVLDYSLYSSRQKLIPLSNEIKSLEKYLSLFANSNAMKLIHDFDLSLLESELQIQPLTLLNLSETVLTHWNIDLNEELLIQLTLKSENSIDLIFRSTGQFDQSLSIPLTELLNILKTRLNIQYLDQFKIENQNHSKSIIQIQINL